MKNKINRMYDFSVLRELRKNEDFNIAVVSGRSGVSASVISKLERNQCSAELETIYKLGRVFGLNSSDLLRLAESRAAHKKKSTAHTSDGFKFRDIAYGNVRCLFGTAKAGSKTSRPEIHKDDYELCWVLSGKVMTLLPHEKHLLCAGDAIQFDALLQHEYDVIEDCTILIIHVRKDKRF
jgi:transcriptional regulator with XRE-family HTH domain